MDVANVAAAIGEPARARMLYSLMDGHARTATELAMVAEVTPSTASVHLRRLQDAELVSVVAQGKHRHYNLKGANVARALESLSVIAAGSLAKFVPNTPAHLHAARTCYDHMAGAIAVSLHDAFRKGDWLSKDYKVTPAGSRAFIALGIDVDATQSQRRTFARPCLDWSERRPHLGGALGAAVLQMVLKRKWMVQELDSRALTVTGAGRREMSKRFGVQA